MYPAVQNIWAEIPQYHVKLLVAWYAAVAAERSLSSEKDLEIVCRMTCWKQGTNKDIWAASSMISPMLKFD